MKVNKQSIENIDLKDILEYIENGPGGEAPSHINQYLDLLDKIRGMHKRIDKYGSPEAIIKHLMVHEGLKRNKAKQMYEEALEYFYADNHISNKAWRNIYAEKLDQLINFAMNIMKDVNDMVKISKAITDAYKARGLDQPDQEELPEEIFNRPFKVYTANPEDLGMPKIDRNKLKALIEDKIPGLTEKEKQALFMEADIDGTFKAFLDEQEDPRRS
ncbi:hypothetical protein [Flavobacterium rhizosphaerae]|uniref:Phage protein n=1 Tax=Flavobacterium rhizosphaerae TaxID=3163298 RepID=A0ABW8YXR3_9FLAO